MGRPLVSVCIPSYNHARYLPAALDSVLAQTYPSVEIVVVDDGSTDGSLDILHRYAERHPNRVRVFTHPGGAHRGISATANLAFQQARGEYWCGLCSDDVFFPEKLARQVAFLEAHPECGLVYGHVQIIDAEGRLLPWLHGVDITSEPDPLAREVEQNCIFGQTVMARRRCLERLGELHDEALVYSDWELWIRFLAHNRAAFLPEPLVGYRVHAANTSVGVAPAVQRERHLAVMETVRRKAEAVGGGLARPRIRALVELQLAFLRYCEGHLEAAAAHLRAAAELDPDLLRAPDFVAGWLIRRQNEIPVFVDRPTLRHDVIAWVAERGQGEPRLAGLQPASALAAACTPKGLVSILVPLPDDAGAARGLLETVVGHTDRAAEILVADSGVSEAARTAARESLAGLRQAAWVSGDYGAVSSLNTALAQARGAWVAVVDPRAELAPGWAARLLEAAAARPAATGVWGAGPGRFLALRRDVLAEIGGFDPLFEGTACWMEDLLIRLRLAGHVVAVADALARPREVGGAGTGTRNAEEALGRRLLAAKWGLPSGGATDPWEGALPSEADPSFLYVPLAYREIFNPDVPPLALDCTAARRWLCVPDPSDEGGAWRRFLEEQLVRMAGSAGAEALVVRLEPADGAWLGEVQEAITSAAERCCIDLDQVDVIIEARRLPSAERGRVYRAATAYVPLPGLRRSALTREARACGLPIVEPASFLAAGRDRHPPSRTCRKKSL